jgi:hypothetical protein
VKLPVKGSRAVLVLEQLRQEPCTVQAISARHADFGLSFGQLVDIYDGLIAIGCVELSIDVYSVTAQARRHFDRASAPVSTPGEVVAPAYRPEPRPLKRPAMRIGDMREGAADYQGIPSRIGDRRYAYGQGK